MISGKMNKIGNISDSNIGSIEQTNIEKQENNYVFNNFQLNAIDGRFCEMTMSHELFPYYAVDFKRRNDGRYALVSRPTCKESLTKYPPNVKSTCTIIDERYKNIKNRDELIEAMQFADSPIEVKVNSITHYLGDISDPYPDPDLCFSPGETKSYILPPKRELPDIKLNVDVRFEKSQFKLSGIQLKLTKQISKNTFIMNNYHQRNKPVFFEIKLQLEKEKIQCNITHKINENKETDSSAIYTYHRFVLNAFTHPINMYEKETGKIILFGKSNKRISNKELQSLKKYIDLIKKVKAIERYFDVKFKIPNQILKDDIETIYELYNNIMSEQNKINFVSVTIPLDRSKTDEQRIKKLINIPKVTITQVTEKVVFNIFETDINIKKLTNIYNNVKCINIEAVDKCLKEQNNKIIKVIMGPVEGKYLNLNTEIIK